MNKPETPSAKVSTRLSALRKLGLDKDAQSLLKTSTRLQIGFLPLESVLAWLDEQIVKSIGFKDKNNSDKSP